MYADETGDQESTEITEADKQANKQKGTKTSKKSKSKPEHDEAHVMFKVTEEALEETMRAFDQMMQSGQTEDSDDDVPSADSERLKGDQLSNFKKGAVGILKGVFIIHPDECRQLATTCKQFIAFIRQLANSLQEKHPLRSKMLTHNLGIVMFI